MPRQTRFSDVCGTIDEIKRLVHEDRDRTAADPSVAIAPLIEDALFMLDRMKERLGDNKAFRDQLGEMLSLMDELEDIDVDPALEAARSVQDRLRAGTVLGNDELTEIGDSGEEIRRVAGDMETRLRAYMDLALKIHDAFEALRGSRPWLMAEDEAESFADELKRTHQAWLPPEPHRSELLRFLLASRATVIPAEEPGAEPTVQFADGGAIPMSRVRYDPAIRNFHPSSYMPGPSGRRYRGETAD